MNDPNVDENLLRMRLGPPQRGGQDPRLAEAPAQGLAPRHQGLRHQGARPLAGERKEVSGEGQER
jgi:hypothetical protein